MINAYFGTSRTPFETDTELKNELLEHQLNAYTRLIDQANIGGFSVVVGEPGTGKTIFKQALTQLPDKQYNLIIINRSIYSWSAFLSLLAHAMEVEPKGRAPKIERSIIKQATKLKQRGRDLILVIDDAHLIAQNILKRIRLLLEDFPRNTSLVLIGQLELLAQIRMRENEEILSRVTNSAEFKLLSPADTESFILNQLDLSALPHSTFTHEAIALITKVSNGNLRATKNLCISSMLEAIRTQTKTIDISHVNKVLDQPHWRRSTQLEGIEPVSFTNQRPDYKDPKSMN